MELERVLVVGGGMAGAHTARLLRERGFTGTVTLLAAETSRAYDRPPLSKAVLSGSVSSADELAFPVDLDAMLVDARYGERAVAWAPGLVTSDSGAEHPYDALVIATGSEPVRLPHAEDALTLRSFDDAVRLRESLKAGSRLAVVGAGWIGAEVATAARHAGCEVTIYEAQERPLAALFPASIGDAMAAWYADAGVRLRLSSPVTDAHLAGADSVLIAVGARPDVRWLGPAFEYAGDGALRVDEHLATNIPGVYALGDCAAYRSLRYGHHIRVEHWDNALRAPEAAASNVLGGDTVHDPVPYFWSEQFGRMVQYVGRHSADDRMVLRGTLTDPSWTAAWLDAQSRLTAVLAVGKPRDLAQGRKLIAASAILDPSRTADPATPLTAAAA